MKKYPDQYDVEYVVGKADYDLISSREYDRSLDILSAKSSLSLSLSISSKLAPMLTSASFSTPSVIGTVTVILYLFGSRNSDYSSKSCSNSGTIVFQSFQFPGK
jgi:hypothetical protein